MSDPIQLPPPARARYSTRAAALGDAAAIARIYNEGIEDRISTFETRPRTAQEIESWFGGHPILVVEEAGAPVGFAALSQFRARACYAGVAELSIYVARTHRGRGAGAVALRALVAEAEAAALWKIIAGVFTGNEPSLRLLGAAGFREIGVYRKHAKLDGAWKDVVLLELLLGEARDSSSSSSQK
jgi:phosphinothricin acetyltransferase